MPRVPELELGSDVKCAWSLPGLDTDTMSQMACHPWVWDTDKQPPGNRVDFRLVWAWSFHMIHLTSPPQEVYEVGFATTNGKIGTQGHRASRDGDKSLNSNLTDPTVLTASGTFKSKDLWT